MCVVATEMQVEFEDQCVRTQSHVIHAVHRTGWRFGLVHGNALASINVVALRQIRLVPRWVTACGRVNRLGM